MPIPVVLATHDAEWPRAALACAESLAVLGSCLLEVHHIGSTSVPGLIAKPILDLTPVVTDLNCLDQHRPAVKALGYDWLGEFGIPGRRYCKLDDESVTRRIQLHFFEAGSPHIERHLAFRDYLRAHPPVMEAYANEKRRAAALHPNDSYEYGDEKAAWVVATEIEALAWYRRA